jgi:UDP-3-O-[3-hydroxymyristoyl] N-acetylglucosamine deacetylase
MLQKTLKMSINAHGIGLHSGQPVLLKLNPAPVDTGIVFQRVDLPHQPKLKLNLSLSSILAYAQP